MGSGKGKGKWEKLFPFGWNGIGRWEREEQKSLRNMDEDPHCIFLLLVVVYKWDGMDEQI